MNYELKEVCENDRELLYKWINDEQCRKNSFHTELVSYEEHCQWFAGKLIDEMCNMYIYYYQNQPIGHIRIDCKKDIGYISYFVVCEYRGQGHGCKMLQLVEAKMRGRVNQLSAFVKYDNVASQMVFKKNNYIEIVEKECIKYCKEVIQTNTNNRTNEPGVIVLTNI